ncbi:GIY-YIG nuclease family protein [Patescibacteria group bacterium]
MPYVYILKTSKNTYYVGSTNDLDKRIKRHQLGNIRSTKERV